MIVTHCPVCGFGPFDPPYSSVAELSLSCDICPCCYCEYGYDDTHHHQQTWLDAGGPWHHDSLKPLDWSLQDQLEHAIEGWRGLGCGFARAWGYEHRFEPEIEKYLRWIAGADVKRRLTATMVLGWLEDDRVEPALQSVADDPDEDIHRLARDALDGRKEYRQAGHR